MYLVLRHLIRLTKTRICFARRFKVEEGLPLGSETLTNNIFDTVITLGRILQ